MTVLGIRDESMIDQLIKQGYEPNVARFRYEEYRKHLVEEFNEKNYTLQTYYDEIPYYDFMETLFEDQEKVMTICTGDSSAPGYQEMSWDNALDFMCARNDVYLSPNKFFNSCYSLKTVRAIRAFVIDIDKVKPKDLDAVIKNGQVGSSIPQPTMIVNSGSGVHFYYVFDKPIPFFKKYNMPLIKKVFDALFYRVDHSIISYCDKHSLVQAFRVPGSLTKLDLVCTGFKTGDKWNFRSLAKYIYGSNFDDLKKDFDNFILDDFADNTPDEWKEKKNNVSNKKTTKKKVVKREYSPNTGFYNYCLERCYKDVEDGHRYTSMVALVTVAVKSNIPKETVQADLEKLVVHYNTIANHMKPSELKNAMRVYNSSAYRTPSTKLEDWFGFEFRRIEKIKAKGLNQKDHLEIARAIRDVKTKQKGKKVWWEGNGRPNGSSEKKDLIANWVKEHPNGKKIECQRELNISRPTIIKWWPK